LTHWSQRSTYSREKSSFDISVNVRNPYPIAYKWL
jgi:hypothetical protein